MVIIELSVSYHFVVVVVMRLHIMASKTCVIVLGLLSPLPLSPQSLTGCSPHQKGIRVPRYSVPVSSFLFFHLV